jgi:putative flippase GtrA
VVGVVVGGTFAFFANRYFAFRDRQPGLAKPAVRFVLATLVAIAVHAWMVGLLADRMGVPVVLAKLAADVAVFSVGQLLVLRYIVFPRAEPPAPAEGAGPRVTEASLQ